MNREFKERYAERGRELQFMGFPIDEMETEELYAVIGFLLEQAGGDTELTLAQEAPHRAAGTAPTASELTSLALCRDSGRTTPGSRSLSRQTARAAQSGRRAMRLVL